MALAGKEPVNQKQPNCPLCGNPIEEDYDGETGERYYPAMHWPCWWPAPEGTWIVVLVSPDGTREQMLGQWVHQRAAQRHADDYTRGNPQFTADYQARFGTPIEYVGKRFVVEQLAAAQA